MTRLLIAAALLLLPVLLSAGAHPGTAASTKYHFALKDLESGDKVDMCDLTDRPLVVLVWAPDCENCQRHMPYVASLYRQLNTDEVNFVSCSMNADRELNLEYVSSKKLSFPVLQAAGGDISSSFTKDGWPTTFVFAPGGELLRECSTQGSAYVDEVLGLLEKEKLKSAIEATARKVVEGVTPRKD